MYFPTLIKSPSARVSAFIDFGNVYSNADDFNIDTLRYSAGVSVLWRAPVGPQLAFQSSRLEIPFMA